MKKIKNFGLILVIICIGMTSCEDQLAETLYSELGDQNAFVTKEDALSAVNGIYEPLLLIANRPIGYIFDMPTDVCYRFNNPTEILNQNDLNTQQDVTNLWPRLWNIITRANIVLDRVSIIADEKFDTDITKAQTLKNNYLGEAYAMRAWAYTMLSDVYYRVPLVLDSKTDIAAKLALNTIDEIDSQIIKDLEVAIPLLPSSYTTNKDGGRVTKGAAQGFQMRAYMRRAGRIRTSGGDATKDWTAALALTNIIIPQYSLVTDIWEGLYNPKSETALYNKESIFKICSNGNGVPGVDYADLGMNYTPWEFDAGWNLFQIPLEFWWKFEMGDKRAESWDQWTTTSTWRGMIADKYPDVYNNPNNPTSKLTYYVVSPTQAGVGLHGIAETTIGSRKEVTLENFFVATIKYKYTKSLTYNYQTNNNFYILRLADVILCKAECINELFGPIADAVAAVNQIRSRAFGNDMHGLTNIQIASRDALRIAICDERAFELHNEGTRRQDLIRMGLWKTKMLEHFEAIKTTVMTKETNYQTRPENAGKPRPDYSADWKVYPFDLKENDARRYYPIPKKETDYNPLYLLNREGME